MFRVFSRLIDRYFSDEEAVILAILLVVGIFIIVTMGAMLAPVIAALAVAFLLQGAINWLEQKNIPHSVAVFMVFSTFIMVLVFAALVMMPLIWGQVIRFVEELPAMVQKWQVLLLKLPDRYPTFISAGQIHLWMQAAQGQLGSLGHWIVSFSIAHLPNFVGLLIYLILVPLLVFFFLKDRITLLSWVNKLLPSNRKMLHQVGEEMSQQISNYIRGKVAEILIVGSVSFVAFIFLGINYAALLAVLVGLSVVVPYVGAAVVTIPVMLVALFQWGLTQEFWVLMIVYGVIQALDGNILVPLLFSEAVNLHPVAIITAVLVFGGIWGFWGIFFAIPLANLCKAVMNAWPCLDKSD